MRCGTMRQFNFREEHMKDILDSVKHVHFVGIGGSGMSPVAEILHSLGYAITGSDVNESDNVNRLRGLGIPIYIGHDAAHVQGADLVVYTERSIGKTQSCSRRKTKIFRLSSGQRFWV